MKFTGEMAVSMTGVVLFGLLLVGLFGNVYGDSEIETILPAGESINQIIHWLGNSVLYLIVISFICGLAGFVAVILLREQDKAETGGRLLIIIAIVSSLSTLGLGIFGSVAYLLAGIRTLMRQQSLQTMKEKGDIDHVYDSFPRV
ncbi:DUF4064 domain-containing protein [Gracilibacillus alcaliphilus]|uniref:DUF4064 domain-containing protein n=1 Tax=Gracilibacillus alcaliphilus TaxID=1401441 RepID=UPI00195B2897|nr:DUF4064 domain-containing protein [Gracilibacillus alcaliphilus]MBM7679438.1 hypothetical protein [Gracilibacillus alcaliphilus]